MSKPLPTSVIRQFGRRLRANRETGGHNLSLLASALRLSVVQITALEEGNLRPFGGNELEFVGALRAYAQELSIAMPTEINLALSDNVDDERQIPLFLRKR